MASVIAGKRSDRIFFGLMGLAILAAVIVGFAQSYFLPGLIFAKLPNLLVHIHGALFVGWIFLLALQIGFVSTGHVRWHRRLGIVGAIMAPLMIIFGVCTLVYSLRQSDTPVPAPLLLAGDLLFLLFFAIFIAWGLRVRTQPAVHKRLMIFGTLSLLAPALDRWPYDFMRMPQYSIPVYLLFPLAIVIYDLITTRRVLPVTRWNTGLFILMLAGVMFIPAIPAWQQFANWVAHT